MPLSRRLLVVAAIAALLPSFGGREAPARPQTVAVGYGSRAALAAALAGHPADIVRVLPSLRVAEVRPRADAGAFARSLRRLPGIRYVERPSPRDAAAEPALARAATGVPYEWQYLATRANAVQDAVQRAAAEVTIAVVDTGADLTAPDIAAKSPLTWSVVAGSPEVLDVNGHGTFVASLAAGSVDNGEGIAGFGGDARLMVVQANRDVGSFTDMDEAQAITWAVDNGARIVNLSIGGATTSRTERDAIDYAAGRGVLLVAAAGNDFGRGNPLVYPAALIQPVGSKGVGGRGLVVAASTPEGTRAPFSSAGSYVSVAAPGVDVVGAVSSTAPGSRYGRVTLPGSVGGLYGRGSGTSYAAPQVAGAAALVWAASPSLTAAQVAEILKETASGRGTWNSGTGYGVVDVAAAVARAAGIPLRSPTVALSGRRVGGDVRLLWRFPGAAEYRLKVSEDAKPVQLLLTGRARRAAYPLARGHGYVFTVDALDRRGTTIATSDPLRVSAPREPRYG